MKKEKCSIPVNLFTFGFADEVAQGQQFDDEVIGRCIEAVENIFEPAGGINRNITSHALRELMEKHLGEKLSNGEFIMAMLRAGYACERVKCTANCYFNVSPEGVSAIREINKKKAGAGE
ncbi:MAG: hypothetical protein KDD10_06735 [Phaeodactylibacter sp.]|nr:hypothetical protein [Phaeodactylibacter sp.]MCB9297907.1 hypothetical protein [Lewinellaceae bacterium]